MIEIGSGRCVPVLSWLVDRRLWDQGSLSELDRLMRRVLLQLEGSTLTISYFGAVHWVTRIHQR